MGVETIGPGLIIDAFRLPETQARAERCGYIQQIFAAILRLSMKPSGL